jgi:hypothetical protein
MPALFDFLNLRTAIPETSQIRKPVEIFEFSLQASLSQAFQNGPNQDLDRRIFSNKINGL